MANPNIVGVTSIYGESLGWHLPADLETTLLTVSSDKLIKVNRITCTNVDGTNSADLTLFIDTSVQTSSGATVTAGAANIYLALTVSVPPDSVLVVSDTPIYLREGDVLKGGSNSAADLDLFISYEVIDDA